MESKLSSNDTDPAKAMHYSAYFNTWRNLVVVFNRNESLWHNLDNMLSITDVLNFFDQFSNNKKTDKLVEEQFHGIKSFYATILSTLV